MKIQDFRKKSDIINVPLNFARIEDVRRNPSDGSITFFSYEFSYELDRIAAIRDDITSIRITVRAKAPKKSPSVWSNDEGTKKSQVLQPPMTIKKLLKVSTKKKNQKLANTTTAIKTVNVNVKPKLPKNIAKKIKLAKSSAEAETFIPKQKVVLSRLVSKLKSDDKSTPILKTAINSTSVKSIDTQPQPVNYSSTKLQSNSLKLILDKGIDPSIVQGVMTKVTTSAQSYAGIQSKTPKTLLKKLPKFISIQPKTLAPFVTLNSKPTMPTTDNVIFDDIEIPVVESVALKNNFVKNRILLSGDQIGDLDTFHVTFKLIDASDNVVSIVSRVVKHKNILNIFETPRTPPIVKAAPVQLPGKNVIEVQQQDEQAIAVKLYRRTINRLSNVNDTVEMAYEFAGEVPVSTADGVMKVVDIVNNTSPVIYRFIPVGPNGNVGTSFSNIVVPGTRKGLKRRRRVTSAAIDVIARGELAIIKVTNIIEGPVAVGIQRRNRTQYERNFEFVSDKPIALTDNRETLRFVDNMLKPDNIYEYRLLLYYEDGSEELSTAYTVYEHIEQDRSGVEIVVTDPQVVKTVSRTRKQGGLRVRRPGASFDVKFGIKSNIQKLDADIVYDVLKSQGLEDLYQTEIKDAREKLSQLVAHRVQRVNTTTGELEDFGVVTGEVFSDTLAGRTKATKPVVPGVTYRYLITTLLRSAETLLEEYEKVATSDTKLTGTAANPSNLTTQQYQYKPSKFKHPRALRRGVLTSEISRRRQSGREEFNYGIIGNTKSIEVTIPSAAAGITRPTVQRIDRLTNAVRWNVTGDITTVDYFVVVFNHLGTDQVVGMVHPANNTSTFEFIHDLSGVDVGTGTYTVRTMLTNFESGPTSTSGRFVV